MKILKKTTALISCGILLATNISYGTFAEGIQEEDGWQIIAIEGSNADADVSKLKDNDYCVVINNRGGLSNGGTDRWDLQFAYRDFEISSEDTYRITFDLLSSSSGKFFTKIGDIESGDDAWHNGNSNAKDLASYWNCIEVGAGKTYHMDCTFTPAISSNSAELSFHIGGDGQYTANGCFPEGTCIEFSNFTLTNLTTGESLLKDNIVTVGDSDITIGESSDILGDCNLDGKVSSVDLLILKKYLLGINSSVYNGDVNQDGKVSTADLLTLKKILLTM